MFRISTPTGAESGRKGAGGREVLRSARQGVGEGGKLLPVLQGDAPPGEEQEEGRR